MDPTTGFVTLRFPDGRVLTVPGSATIGRGAAASVRVEGACVSGIHLELSPRAGGVHVLARGGELRVDGRTVPGAVVQPGQRWWIAPDVELTVLRVEQGTLEDPGTGRPGAIRWTCGGGQVLATARRLADAPRDGVGVTLSGLRAALVAALVRCPGHVLPQTEVFAILWPRTSNVDALRARLYDLRGEINRELGRLGFGDLVRVDHGTVRLVWRDADEVGE